MLALEKILEHQQIAVDDLEHQLITDSVCDVIDLNTCLLEARRKLMATTTLVAKRHAALGVSDQANLTALKCNVYLQVSVNQLQIVQGLIGPGTRYA